MKKIFSTDIAGQAFQIHEDAYNMLSDYLITLQKMYGDNEDAREILHDIETRIVEIIQEHQATDSSDIINQTLVSNIIDTLGKPNELQEETSFQSSQSSKKFTKGSSKVIAGVCSGISEYLDIQDPIWIRLIFVLTIFMSIGTGILIYIILAALLPPHKNPSPSNAKKNSNPWLTLLKAIVIGMVAIILIPVIVIALVLIFSFFFVGIGSLSLAPIISSIIFESTWASYAVTIAIATLIITIVIFLGMLITQIFFKNRILTKARFFWLSTLGLLSIMVLVVTGLQISKQFQDEATITEKNIIDGMAYQNAIHLRGNSYQFQNDVTSNNSTIAWNELKVLGEYIFSPSVEIHLAQSPDRDIHIFKESYSKGSSSENAFKHIENIDYRYLVKSDSLIFDDYILQEKKKTPYRFQKITLTVYLPENVEVTFDNMNDLITKKPRMNPEKYTLNGQSWMLQDGILVPYGSDVTQDSTPVQDGNQDILDTESQSEI